MKLPRLATWLYTQLLNRVAIRRSPDYIVGADDPAGAYLHRWYLIPRNRVFNIYLHKFLRDDDDRALHDHPWPSCSFILEGGYIEHTIADGGIHSRQYMPPGTLRLMRPKHAHRVELIAWEVLYVPTEHGIPLRTRSRVEFAWTLFITGPRIRRWGFHCPDQGWIDFERFTKPGSTGETGAGCDA